MYIIFYFSIRGGGGMVHFFGTYFEFHGVALPKVNNDDSKACVKYVMD